jgi:hypothetical protein
MHACMNPRLSHVVAWPCLRRVHKAKSVYLGQTSPAWMRVGNVRQRGASQSSRSSQSCLVYAALLAAPTVVKLQQRMRDTLVWSWVVRGNLHVTLDPST